MLTEIEREIKNSKANALSLLGNFLSDNLPEYLIHVIFTQRNGILENRDLQPFSLSLIIYFCYLHVCVYISRE